MIEAMPCWCHAPTCHIMSLGCLAVMQYAQGPGHDGGCACMHARAPPALVLEITARG